MLCTVSMSLLKYFASKLYPKSVFEFQKKTFVVAFDKIRKSFLYVDNGQKVYANAFCGREFQN